MQHHKFPLILALTLAVFVVPGRPAGSQAPAPKATVIRIASLAPPGSSFVKVLKAWSRTLEKETEGRVELRVFSGGSEGSDRDLVKRIKQGKLDAAGVATTGLSMVAPELQVLTAPGLLTDDAQLDRAREKLDGQLQKLIEDGGFKLLAWGDGGKNRVFSSTEFKSPADLVGKSGWAGEDNAVALAYAKAIGANPGEGRSIRGVPWAQGRKARSRASLGDGCGGLPVVHQAQVHELEQLQHHRWRLDHQ